MGCPALGSPQTRINIKYRVGGWRQVARPMFSLEDRSLFLEPLYPYMRLNLILNQRFLTTTLPPTLIFKSTKFSAIP